jgi:hypothetical protein
MPGSGDVDGNFDIDIDGDVDVDNGVGSRINIDVNIKINVHAENHIEFDVDITHMKKKMVAEPVNELNAAAGPNCTSPTSRATNMERTIPQTGSPNTQTVRR